MEHRAPPWRSRQLSHFALQMPNDRRLDVLPTPSHTKLEHIDDRHGIPKLLLVGVRSMSPSQNGLRRWPYRVSLGIGVLLGVATVLVRPENLLLRFFGVAGITLSVWGILSVTSPFLSQQRRLQETPAD